MARGAPRDMQEPTDGLLVGDRHQPRALHLEIPGEPAARLRPRNPRHHHAVHTAFHTRSRAHELDPIAAEILVPPTSIAAPVVVFRAFAPAARATQRGLPAPDARHQDRRVAQRGVVDGHVLDDHALDVEQTFEYVLHKAFSVVLFLGRKTNLQETPLTLWNSTAQRRDDTHENNTRASNEVSTSKATKKSSNGDSHTLSKNLAESFAPLTAP